MKKSFIVLTLFIGVLTLAAADEGDIPESYLRSGITGDFYKLYPEAWFEANPAFILEISEPVFFNAFDFSYDYDGNTKTRTIGTLPAGSPGGSLDDSTSGMSLAPDVTFFMPLDNGSVLGFGGMFFYEGKSNTVRDVNYSTADRTSITVSSSRGWSVSGSGYYALDFTDRLKAGLYGGFRFSSDPYGVTELTDTAVLGGSTHITGFNDEEGVPDSHDEARLSAFTTLGVLLDLNFATLGMGSTFSYGEQVNTAYEIVYSDQGGYEIFTAEKVRTTPAGTDFPDGRGAADFAWKNNLGNTTLDFNFYFLMPLSGNINFLSSGKLGAVDHSVYTRYDRETLEEFQLDSYTRFVNAFDLTAGLELTPSEDLVFRFGAGVSLSLLSQTEDDHHMDGYSIFTLENSNNYPQISFTSEPNNNEVSNQSDPVFTIDLGDDTYSETTLTFRGMIGSRWSPRPGVVLFSSCLFTHKTRTIHKVFFNTYDNTLWKEDEVSSDHQLNLSLALGGGVAVTEDLFIGFKADSALTGQGALTEDFLPMKNGNDSAGNNSSPYADLENPGADTLAVSLYAVLGL